MQGPGLFPACWPQLTYFVALFNAAISGTSGFSMVIDCGVLLVVFAGSTLVARVIRKRNMVKKK